MGIFLYVIYENCFLNGIGTKRGFCLVTGLFIYFYLYSTFILFPELSCRSLLFALFPSLLKGLENLMHWYSWMQLSFPERKCRVIGRMPECGSTASHLT